MIQKGIFFLIIILSAGISSGQQNGLQKIIKPGVLPEKLSDEFSFTEGPTADRRGNVYFTDQPNDRIMIWTTDDKLITFMQPSGRSNGMFFDSNGNLWSCADEKTALWKISPDKNVEIILNTYNGNLLNGPNDLWIAPGGGIYFTDPFYRRTWWSHKEMPQDKQRVYYLYPDHKTLISVEDNLLQPNGIIGTRDGKTLYVADIRDNKTWSYTINSDGTLSDRKLFCNLGSDGMTIDNEGNIYITGRGVTIFDKNGRMLGNIEIPENWTSSVCFGGKNRKILYITASKSLYRIPTRKKGMY
ncbi:MAG: SMP-30/gluconolactonase/LRE family protein [Bacteroidales bacterium]|nr:SMP-30/gluconolactonase/LRE family protein [Bacteroidales bacterium]